MEKPIALWMAYVQRLFDSPTMERPAIGSQAE